MPMVISDERRFAFVHIPKTGGTTIGRQLVERIPFDPAFAGGVTDCPRFGRCYLQHLALWQIRDMAPKVLEKILVYDSMAIVRDPLDRFRSAVSQFTRNTQSRELSTLTRSELNETVDFILRGLHGPELGTMPFTFFRRQCDQIFLDGQRYVSRLFDYRDLKGARVHIERVLGITIDLEKTYRRTRNFRPGYRQLRKGVAPAVKALLPARIYDRIKAGTTDMLETKSNPMLEQSLDTPRTDRMLRDFYGPDFDLLKLTEGTAAERVSVSPDATQGGQ